MIISARISESLIREHVLRGCPDQGPDASEFSLNPRDLAEKCPRLIVAGRQAGWCMVVWYWWGLARLLEGSLLRSVQP